MGKLTIKVGDKSNTQFAPGFSADKKNEGDAYKGAKTDSLSKAASMFGVGNDVFKGLVDPTSFELKSVAAVPKTTLSGILPGADSAVVPAPFQTRSRRKAVENGKSTGDDI